MLLSLTVGTIGYSQKKGCTNPDAKNYDSDPKKSNNSCKYESSVVFLYMQSVSAGLINNGITSLAFYVDEKFIGSSSASVYFNGIPECNTSNVIKYTADLG